MQYENGHSHMAGQISPAEVFSCLQQALKADQQARQAAESELAAWQERPGYCSCLLVSTDVRDRVLQASSNRRPAQVPGMHRQSYRAERTTAPGG